MIEEDYTTQYMGNYNSPMEESLDEFPAKLIETIETSVTGGSIH